MTFAEIKTEIKDRLHYVSAEADARVGRLINKVYRELTASIGLSVAREVSVLQTTTPNEREVVFAGVEKLLSVWYEGGGGKPVVLEQVLPAELVTEAVPASNQPRRFAVRRMGAGSVTIWLDVLPASAFNLRADGISEVVDLTGTQEPAFPESFHDIIIEGVLKDEYQKLEKVQLARLSEERYHRRLSDLRMFIAKSNFLDVYQNKQGRAARRAGGGGSGVSNVGLNQLDLTVTGHWTFDRDPLAPFSVTAGSAVVPNLDADKLDGQHASEIINAAVTSAVDLAVDEAVTEVGTRLQAGTLPHGSTHGPGAADPVQVSTTDRLLGRDTAGAGSVELIAVSGGLEFTGTGGIRRSALSGDVTASAGSDTTTIAPDAVTYAKMQNVSAASRLLGRGDSGAGDPQEISLGAGLSMSGTTLSVTSGGTDPGGSDGQVQFNDGGVFGGDAGLTYNKTTDTLTLAGPLVANGGRIVFPATQNASSDANTLDDYEEGAWTPVLGGSGGTSGQSYVKQEGHYTKIGRLVVCVFYIGLSNKGTITGDLRIQGLPFTIRDQVDVRGCALMNFENLATNKVQVTLEPITNTTTAAVYALSAASTANRSSASTSDVTNTTILTSTIVYAADA